MRAVVACDGRRDYVSDAEIATIAFAFRHSAKEAAQAIKSVAAARGRGRRRTATATIRRAVSSSCRSLRRIRAVRSASSSP